MALSAIQFLRETSLNSITKVAAIAAVLLRAFFHHLYILRAFRSNTMSISSQSPLSDFYRTPTKRKPLEMPYGKRPKYSSVHKKAPYFSFKKNKFRKPIQKKNFFETKFLKYGLSNPVPRQLKIEVPWVLEDRFELTSSNAIHTLTFTGAALATMLGVTAGANPYWSYVKVNKFVIFGPATEGVELVVQTSSSATQPSNRMTNTSTFAQKRAVVSFKPPLFDESGVGKWHLIPTISDVGTLFNASVTDNTIDLRANKSIVFLQIFITILRDSITDIPSGISFT